jgi:hypothetical protein
MDPGGDLRAWDPRSHLAGDGVHRRQHRPQGMMVAAKTLALTAMDLLTDPAKVAAARASFEKTKGTAVYRSRVPETAGPPLGYRDTK